MTGNAVTEGQVRREGDDYGPPNDPGGGRSEPSPPPRSGISFRQNASKAIFSSRFAPMRGKPSTCAMLNFPSFLTGEASSPILSYESNESLYE